MGRLIVQETISADGFAADPEGRTSFMEPFIGGTAEGFARRQLELIEGLSGMLMGARTYEGFSSFWPTEAAAQEMIAPAFNSLHRYVFSHSHSEAPWGTWVTARCSPATRARRSGASRRSPRAT